MMNDFFDFSMLLSLNNKKLFPADKNDIKYFSFLLSGTINQHPIKYLSLGFWLFENVESLLSAIKYRQKKNKIKRTQKYKISKPDKKIKHSDKALKITESIKNQIYTLAARGFHRSEIARRFNISTGSVEHEITQHTGLADYRKRCKFESRRRRYRLQICRFRKLYPDALRKDIRKANDSAFIWLYLYDRKWLEQILPKATTVIPKKVLD